MSSVDGVIVLMSAVVATGFLIFCPPRRLLSWITHYSSSSSSSTDGGNNNIRDTTPGVRFYFSVKPRKEDQRDPIALTIDDAPSLGTPKLLSLLEKHSIPATFFCIGDNVRANPEIFKQIVRSPRKHEIANHDCKDRGTASVPLVQALNDIKETEDTLKRYMDEVDREVSDSNSTELAEASSRGRSIIKYFRPGKGFFTRELVRALYKQFGYETVLTDTYPHDPALPFPTFLFYHMWVQVAPGSILLLHDGSEKRCNVTYETLARLIPRLKAEGYAFCTLSQMKSYELEQEPKQKTS